MNPALGGLLLVDKPAGVTSFDVVNHVRRRLRGAFPPLNPPRGRTAPGQPRPPKFRCGHAGTLDPMATGLLIVLVGPASRLSPYLLGLDKTYEATVRFGVETATLDREGAPTLSKTAPVSPADVTDVLPRFVGDIEQVPPLISALKRDGKALHERVRAGEDVAEPEARIIRIDRLEVRGVHWDLPAPVAEPGYEPGLLGADGTIREIDLLVDCSSGTYIRSLARDIGRAAGSAAHLHALRRTRIGPLDVTAALAGVMGMGGEELAEAMLPSASGLAHLPALVLNEEETAHVRNGGQPGPEWLERLDGRPEPQGRHGPLLRLLAVDGDLVAVAELDPATGLPRLATVLPALTDR